MVTRFLDRSGHIHGVETIVSNIQCVHEACAVSDPCKDLSKIVVCDTEPRFTAFKPDFADMGSDFAAFCALEYQSWRDLGNLDGLEITALLY